MAWAIPLGKLDCMNGKGDHRPNRAGDTRAGSHEESQHRIHLIVVIVVAKVRIEIRPLFRGGGWGGIDDAFARAWRWSAGGIHRSSGPRLTTVEHQRDRNENRGDFADDTGKTHSHSCCPACR